MEDPRASGRENARRGMGGVAERARAEKRQAAFADSAHPLGITHCWLQGYHVSPWCRGNVVQTLSGAPESPRGLKQGSAFVSSMKLAKLHPLGQFPPLSVEMVAKEMVRVTVSRITVCVAEPAAGCVAV